MKAYKCDACGKLYETYPVDRDTDDVFGTNTLSQGYIADLRTPVLKKRYELCRDCCASFNVWLESRKGSYTADETYIRAVEAMRDYSKGNTDEETEDRHN